MRLSVVTRRLFLRACETAHKLGRAAAVALFAMWVLGTPVRASQPAEPAPSVSGEAEAQEPGHPIVDLIARLVNFGILAGSLWYLLRSPLRQYLVDRGAQIRSDLVNAAEMK